MGHGDERNRTADLLVANQSLSQLSYVPAWSVKRANCGFPQRLCPVAWRSATVHPLNCPGAWPQNVAPQGMGQVGVEPTTSPLSGVRSNQLSYKPVACGQRSAGRAPKGTCLAAKHQLSCKPQENHVLPTGRPCGALPDCGSYRFSNVPCGTRRGPLGARLLAKWRIINTIRQA